MLKKTMVLGVVFVLALFFGLANYGWAGEEGLVAYWKFDEGKGGIVKDATNNGNDGAIYGATWAVNALKFKGANDYVDVPDNASLSALTALSIALWMKSESNAIYQGFVGKYGGGDREWYIDGRPAKDQCTFYLYDESEGGYIGRLAHSAGLFNGKWHHLVGTWDGGTTGASMKLYKDGVQINGVDASKGTFVAVRDLDASVIIGRMSASYPQWDFDGTIDEVRIYNKALTATEVRRIFIKGR
ncbi:MAG: LamG domain-containing protein [bacterium]|nr:LamG domain-containing protein [bacterium]